MEQNLRSYLISDADLISECSRINYCAMRDINEFMRHKITPDYLFDFETATFFFSDFLTEEEMQDEVNFLIENKEGIAELIVRKISCIKTIAEDLWGKEGRYKTFGFEDNMMMPDNEFLLMVKRVVRISRRFFADLEMRGLTQEMISQLSDLVKQYVVASNLETAAMEDSDTNKRMRNALRDNLYQVVSHLSQTGMYINENGNAATYNDYLLCNERSNASHMPQTA